MNGRWLRPVLILIGVLTVAIGYGFLLPSKEPSYNGQRLSFWLRHLNVPIPESLRRGISAYALTQLGPGALPSLCESNADPKFIHQLVIDDAMRGISRQADANIVPALLRLADHPRGEVRGEMAAAFGCMGTNINGQSPAVVAALTRLLTDPHPYPREEAAFALWEINRDTNAVSVLVIELEETSDSTMGLTILNHFRSIKATEDSYPAISNIVNRSVQLRKLFAPSPFE